MTRGKRILGRSLMSLAALAVCAALAGSAAAQLELGGRTTPQVVTPPLPGSSSMVVTSPTLQADKITAQEVRANTIYANRIDADRIQGVVYQTGGVTMNSANSIGDIQAPQVTASVIYADQIRAGQVSADTIYVRNLRQR